MTHLNRMSRGVEGPYTIDIIEGEIPENSKKANLMCKKLFFYLGTDIFPSISEQSHKLTKWPDMREVAFPVMSKGKKNEPPNRSSILIIIIVQHGLSQGGQPHL